MDIIAFEADGPAMIGRLLENGDVVPVAPVATFFEDLATGLESARRANADPLTADQFRLVPATPDRAKIICVGLNYKHHATETGMPIPQRPVIFGRWTASLAVDGSDVPAVDERFDWEGELAVIVGQHMFSVSAEDARQGIFAYAAFNDFSCRTYQGWSPQWTLGKNSPNSGPLGVLTTADALGDPAEGWRILTMVNGDIMQDSLTSDLIFPVPQLISDISQVVELKPGDVIATGTPAGVGLGQTPQRFLKPGDTVEVRIEGLHPLRNRVVSLHR